MVRIVGARVLNTRRQSKPCDQRSDQTRVPVVYFDSVVVPGFRTDPVIKIGESENHNKRRNDLSKSKFGIEFKVEHLCVVRGTRSDEQRLLKYFERHKLENEEETFSPVDELVDYIRWLRDQWFVWVPDDEQCLKIDELEIVDSSLWIPTPERRKPKPRQIGLFSEFDGLCLPPRELTVDDFYTPRPIVNASREAMGGIDLDPASHALANRLIQASGFYTSSDNGLNHEWKGRVWLNPPFSQWQLWAPKIIAEWESGRVQAMCVLCATRTLTAQYLSCIHEHCSAICILRGRIAFWGGLSTPSPDDGHAIFYFGKDTHAFLRAFAEIGNCYVRLEPDPCPPSP